MSVILSAAQKPPVPQTPTMGPSPMITIQDLEHAATSDDIAGMVTQMVEACQRGIAEQTHNQNGFVETSQFMTNMIVWILIAAGVFKGYKKIGENRSATRTASSRREDRHRRREREDARQKDQKRHTTRARGGRRSLSDDMGLKTITMSTVGSEGTDLNNTTITTNSS